MGPLERYRTAHDLPTRLAIFPLAGALLLPRTKLPLNIFEPRYLAMVHDAMANSRIIGMVQPAGGQPADGTSDGDDAPAVQSIGCAGRITSYAETDDGRLLIVLTGIARFQVVAENETSRPYREVEADFTGFAGDLIAGLGEADVDRRVLIETLRIYLEARQLVADWDEVEAASTEALVNSLSALSPYPAGDKQALLEAADLKARADMLVALTEMALARAEGADGPRLQ
ncbi:MAG TPA: LON peptidase substrate-binding domain-containing protein [Aestuariivirgaceae bacterium]|nr:LON peptidase substrate-binding domain-containing protein [Aestuariivirgaceae bacterium]